MFRHASTTRSRLKPGRNTLPTLAPLARFRDRLSLPLIAAPMFLVSGVELVVAACRNGVIGSFPTVNCRSPEQLDEWLTDIDIRLKAHSDANGKPSAPVCANLIVHRDLRAVPRIRECIDFLVAEFAERRLKS